MDADIAFETQAYKSCQTNTRIYKIKQCKIPQDWIQTTPKPINNLYNLKRIKDRYNQLLKFRLYLLS